MTSERLYIVKTVEGEELPPADQETLIKWAESGKIKAMDQVRSTLIAKWDKCVNLPFLKQILLAQQEAEVLKQERSAWSKLVARVTLKAPELVGGTGLVSTRLETYPSASAPLRLMAILTDMVILLAIAIAIFFACMGLFRAGTLNQANGASVCMTAIFFAVFLYYLLQITFTTQTVGQRYWGIFLIRRDGQPFWMGRVFFYCFFMMIFGILTPIFLVLGGRSIQELLTGTRMAKVKLVKNRS